MSRARLRVSFALLAATAGAATVAEASCATFTAAPDADGGAPAADGGPDARATALEGGSVLSVLPCDAMAPFNAPIAFPAPINQSLAGEQAAVLSEDLQTMVLSSGRSPPPQIYASTVNGGAWGPLVPVMALNGPDARHPSLTENRDTIYFASRRDPAGSLDIWTANRNPTSGKFTAPLLEAAANSTSDDFDPWVVDGQLYFASSRNSNTGGEIFVTTPGVARAAAVPVLGLSSGHLDRAPVLTGDQLTVFFASNRQPSASIDIWTATRTSTDAAFGTPTPVSELSSTQVDLPTWISANGCTIILGRSPTVGGDYTLFYASRP